MIPTHPLLARLWPALTLATAAGCANKPPTTEVPPAPTTSNAIAPTGTAGAPTNTGAAALPTAKTASAPLTRCHPCNQHCYAHAPGETCLPDSAGAVLDAKVACIIQEKSGPFDDGKQCCYGGPCPGRPLLREAIAVIAPLVRGAAQAGWA